MRKILVVVCFCHIVSMKRKRVTCPLHPLTPREKKKNKVHARAHRSIMFTNVGLFHIFCRQLLTLNHPCRGNERQSISSRQPRENFVVYVFSPLSGNPRNRRHKCTKGKVLLSPLAPLPLCNILKMPPQFSEYLFLSSSAYTNQQQNALQGRRIVSLSTWSFVFQFSFVSLWRAALSRTITDFIC